MKRKELSGIVLPTSREVLEHCYHIRQILMDTDPKFIKKLPSFQDTKEVVIADVSAVWNRTSLPTIEPRSIHTKLKLAVEMFAGARKKAAKLHLADVNEEWLNKTIDISKCRSSILTPPQIHKDKMQCKCSFDDRVPATEVEFLLYQKNRTEKCFCRQLETWFMPSVGKNHYTKQKGAKLLVTAQKHPQPVKKGY